MKKRTGKCRMSRLELVEAKETLDPLLDFLFSRTGPPRMRGGRSDSSTTGLPTPSDLGASATALSFTHRVCIPAPLWPPTPALRSSPFFRTRQTSFGHLGSTWRGKERESSASNSQMKDIILANLRAPQRLTVEPLHSSTQGFL